MAFFQSLAAQDTVPTAINPSNNSGDLPYSTSIGTTAEHIELSSGNLLVNVPFVSVPGRRMSFDYGLRYDARFWTQVNQKWNPEMRNWVTSTALGWTPMQGYLTFTAGKAYCVENDGREPTGTSGSPASILYYAGGAQANNYIFTDRRGQKHSFLVNRFSSGECDSRTVVTPPPFDSSNFAGPSPDMDGYYGSALVSNFAGIKIVGPDGTTYFGGGSSSGTTVFSQNSYFKDYAGEQDLRGNSQVVSVGTLDSIGRTPITQQVSGNTLTYTYTDSNGVQQVTTVTLQNTAISTQFNAPPFVEYAGNRQLVSGIKLPNNQAYSFSYDNWGEITSLTFPTGASVSYQWSTVNEYGTIMRAVTQRTVSHDGLSEVWDISYQNGDPLPSGEPTTVVTVTAPPDNQGARYQTVYSYSDQEHLRTVQYLASAGGKQILRYDLTWDGTRTDPNGGSSENSLLTSIKTTLENGQTSLKEIDYDLYAFPYQILNCSDYSSGWKTCADEAAGGQFGNTPSTYLQPPVMEPGSHGNVTAIREYDWGSGSPGPLLRQTLRTYLHDGVSGYFNAPNASGVAISNISNRVLSEVVYDGSQKCSGTGTFLYDGKGTIQPPAACTANRVAETDYEYDLNSPSSYGYYGEVTAMAHWNNSGASPKTQYSYDSFGNVQTVTDPRGNVTTYGYTDSWTGSLACLGSGAANAYLTSVTNALNQRTSRTYYGCSGKVASNTDANSAKTGYSYDGLGRKTGISLPNGGSSTITYDDAAHTVDVQTTLSSGNVHEVLSKLDQLGRAFQDKLLSDPQGTIYTDTAYDALGRESTVSNPYRSSSDKVLTTNTYDARGRKVTQVLPDGDSKKWQYAGNTTTVTDEASNSSLMSSDALGRLSSVQEPGGLVTQYGYNPMGDLLSVQQVGTRGEVQRSRSFTYDSLSRLITSKNPETGTVCYGTWSGTSVGSGTCQNGYDASGNLLAKTNARGMGTVYTYDALNRLQTKAYFGPGYQDGAVKTYYYDGSRADGGQAGTGLNQIGRLSSARSWAPFGNGLHDEYQSYDVMGRVTGRTEVAQSESGTGGHSIGMAYDLAGNLTSLTYPDGRVVTQGYDSAGRLNSVTDGNGQKYVSSVSYFPNGTPQQMVFSNDNMSEYTSLNSRLQVCETKIGNGGGPGTLFDRQYFYGSDTTSGNQCNDVTTNNGNLMHVLDSMNSTNSQHYTYDSLNRLTHWNGFSPAGTVRQQSFGYDSFGNMAPAASATAPSVTGLFDANNRLVAQTTSDCLSYDAAGNLTCTGTQNTDAHTYGFNEESELVLAWVAQNSTSNLVGQYSFDSSGTRVRSDNPTAHTWREYTYFNGQVLAEKDNTGNWTDHIYANGKHLARVEQVRPLLHVHGVRTQASVNRGCGQNFYLDVGSFGNYTARAGDRIVFQQRSILARGGLAFHFLNGVDVAWGVPDQVGNPINYDAPDGSWHTRVVALPQSVDGSSVQAITVTTEHQTGVGTYDTWIGDVAIVSSDGAVTPVYRGQPVGSATWGVCDDNTGVATEQTPVDGFAGTTYSAGDQVGTTQMEFAVDAWPIQRSEFAPFGQELSSQDFTRNRFKFTGKERDAESGLDYFGARYYSSSMGRWMSPDWADKPEAVPYSDLADPQSLNLYGYVRNNPLSKTDKDGHDCCDWISNAVEFVGGIERGAAQSVFPTSANAPSPNDSMSSLSGQLVGSGIAGVFGTEATIGGGGMVVGGGAAAPVTGGASLGVSAEGVALAGAGLVVAKGAANNASAVGQTMARRAGDFSPSTREGAIKQNAVKNGGSNKCENCGGDVQRVGNQKGQSPPGDQLQVHHDPAIKDGGGKDSKPVVVCRDCHTDIHRQ